MIILSSSILVGASISNLGNRKKVQITSPGKVLGKTTNKEWEKKKMKIQIN
jgi:hypothetical protein